MLPQDNDSSEKVFKIYVMAIQDTLVGFDNPFLKKMDIILVTEDSVNKARCRCTKNEIFH